MQETKICRTKKDLEGIYAKFKKVIRRPCHSARHKLPGAQAILGWDSKPNWTKMQNSVQKKGCSRNMKHKTAYNGVDRVIKEWFKQTN